MFHCHAESNYKKPDFEFSVCIKQFASLSNLNRHKAEEGHNACKTAALPGNSEPPEK